MDSDERKRIFDEWLRAHEGLLFKVVRAYAFSGSDRDDLFQEIALQLWDSIPRFRGEFAVTTWIYRVALYSALSWSQRERTRENRGLALDGSTPVLAETPSESDPRLEWIYAQIAKLEPVDRSLMLLHLDGFSYRDIATTLGLSESHVGVKLNRIKHALSTQRTHAEATDGLR